jgi:hypothetical protein
MKELKREK